MLFSFLLGTVALGTVALAETTPLPSTVEVDGTPFTWKGAVAYGEMDPTVPDLFGYSFGGLGSAMAVKKWRRNEDGSYSGTIVAQPDRGHNTVQLENFAARQQYIEFTLRPCTEDVCNSDAAAPSLTLEYTGGMRYTDASPRNQNGGFTSGLDAINVRPASEGFPVLPEVITGNGALSVDAEGIAYLADGSFFVSDEYGPAIYHIGADGTIISAVTIPDAVLPHNQDGELDFSVEDGATIVSGRTTNQGFEGLTINPENTRLYALLQSALAQDMNPEDEESSEFTRMLVFDISNPDAATLVEEYVVHLPRSEDKVFAQSEVHYVKDGVFLVLARDGKGAGNGDPPATEVSKKKLTSAYKNIGLVTLTGATNIVGQYDGVGDSIAPNGVLSTEVTAAAFEPFIDIIDDAQLARFGLQNGKPIETDIVGKWEALAIAPVLDPNFPDDYFVFTAADNDFLSTKEYVDGVDTGPDPYLFDVPNAFFVYRATLPGAEYPTYLLDQSLNSSGLARRRFPRALCAAGLSQCSLGGGRYECVDVLSSLEQCGACASDKGVDCATLPGVAGVSCVDGTCVIESCEVGHDLVDGACL
ncbi:hypothetical protein JCM6882_005702 [Rhodosporidiobolus microsporus]